MVTDGITDAMSYRAPWWMSNCHFQTIFPALYRRVDDSFFSRERIATEDGDFLDLDWARAGHDRLVVLSHGLEGHSRRPYMLGMARAALAEGWDVLAWNFRSCSGEANRMLTSYHSGQTRDLAQVIDLGAQQGYREIALIGFSIGGNKTLLYLGREAHRHPSALSRAVVFSVPCDLASSTVRLAEARNRIYMINFLKSFRQKLEQKQVLFPGQIDLRDFAAIRNFQDYDSRFTAPMHGFASAEEYWRESSSKPWVPSIQVPTLLVSAGDDPFLPPECYPQREAAANPNFTLEITPHGGHVGYIRWRSERYWSELRAMQFLSSNLSGK